MTTIHPAWLQKPARKPRGAAKPKPVPKPAATLRTCSECDQPARAMNAKTCSVACQDARTNRLAREQRAAKWQPAPALPHADLAAVKASAPQWLWEAKK